jgi:hypothetical protein
MTDLSTYTIVDLERRLRDEQRPGSHTLAACGVCKSFGSRGGGPCAKCLQVEIDVRIARADERMSQ